MSQPVEYTRASLDLALTEVLGEGPFTAMVRGRVGRPKMCEMAASTIVRDMIDYECQCVQTVTAALRDLHIEGQFEWAGEGNI